MADVKWGRALGIGAVLAGGLCGSSAGILVRLVEHADGWQILFFRSVSFSLTVLLFMIVKDGFGLRRRFFSIGVPGVVVALCLGGAFIAYIISMLLTTVANAVFILSASPFMTALMSRWLLKEQISTLSWICMTAGLCGVAFMVADGLLSGTVAGSAVALIATAGYAASIVAYRAGKDIDMMPATCLAGVFAALISLALVSDFAIGRNDLVVACLLGAFQIGGQYILITLAAKHVPATEITLLMLLEVVAAPIWVWIGVGEVPALLTLIGGAIVLSAVAVQAVAGLKSNEATGTS